MTTPPSRPHPSIEPIRLNYDLCVNLHNKVFQLGWVESGRTPESCPSQTWWDRLSPSAATTSRLNSDLVHFLKRAYSHVDVPTFFYFLEPLNRWDHMHDDPFFEARGSDRFVVLHPATGFKMGDEVGLIFDQQTCKAAFVELFDDMTPIVDIGYGWKPLEDIYRAYLDMIDEGKVEVSHTRHNKSDSFGPWVWNDYTTADVQKSFQAFKHLVSVVERQMAATQIVRVPAPWANPATLDAAGIQRNTFARAICEGIAKWVPTLPFHYILHYDGDEGLPIPAGLYLVGDDRMSQAFENACQLLLPLKLGSNGWARLSDHQVLGMTPWDDEAEAADTNSGLYQSGYNGVFGHRNVRIHKVPMSWAERVDYGDWKVTEDGVEGGIRTFHERKYWLPLTW